MDETPEVEIIADGTNRLSLVFPEGTVLKGRKTMSVDDLAKILLDAGDAEVEGQRCGLLCLTHCHMHCRSFTAVSLRG